MSDLEMVRKCAEAMGWTVKPTNDGSGRFKVYEGEQPIMGLGAGWIMSIYNPLTDDAQAMALVRRFKLRIAWHYGGNVVRAIYAHPSPVISSQYQADLNRAIVECVAKMKATS